MMLVNEITKKEENELYRLNNLLSGTQTRRVILNTVSELFAWAINHEIDVTMATSKKVPNNYVGVNAFYDPEADEDDDVAVEVVLVFNPANKSIEWDKNSTRHFVNELVDAVKHELLHAHQHRARDYVGGHKAYDKSNNTTEYMSNADEIDAFAMNIADELHRNSNDKEVFELLRSAKTTADLKNELGMLLSPNLKGYYMTFTKDSSVLKRVLKKVYARLISKVHDKD